MALLAPTTPPVRVGTARIGLVSSVRCVWGELRAPLILPLFTRLLSHPPFSQEKANEAVEVLVAAPPLISAGKGSSGGVRHLASAWAAMAVAAAITLCL